jgi:hypothetical protein
LSDKLCRLYWVNGRVGMEDPRDLRKPRIDHQQANNLIKSSNSTLVPDRHYYTV